MYFSENQIQTCSFLVQLPVRLCLIQVVHALFFSYLKEILNILIFFFIFIRYFINKYVIGDKQGGVGRDNKATDSSKPLLSTPLIIRLDCLPNTNHGHCFLATRSVHKP